MKKKLLTTEPEIISTPKDTKMLAVKKDISYGARLESELTRGDFEHLSRVLFRRPNSRAGIPAVPSPSNTPRPPRIGDHIHSGQLGQVISFEEIIQPGTIMPRNIVVQHDYINDCYTIMNVGNMQVTMREYGGLNLVPGVTYRLPYHQRF